MNRTKIEWVKNPDGSQGYTWNVITGCLNNCSYCFARKLANGRLKRRYLANQCISTTNLPAGENAYLKALADPFYPRFWENRLLQAQDVPQDSGIFVCDMSDLFGNGVPEDWTRVVLAECSYRDDCRFYLLTKQPQNLIKFSPFPDNAYIGVSTTTQKQFDDAVKYLKQIEATIKFISFEPLLERINLGF